MEIVPDFVESCDEVAVITAVPKFAGVNTPEEVMVPSVAPQVTAELYDPVPCTVAVQVGCLRGQYSGRSADHRH